MGGALLLLLFFLPAISLAAEDSSSITSIAFVLAGSARSFVLPSVYQSISHNLIQSLCPSSSNCQSDVFIRISMIDNTLKGLDAQGRTINASAATTRAVHKALGYLHSHYEIVDLGSEDDLATYRLFEGFRHKVFQTFDRRRYSMHLNRWAAYRLMTRHERARGSRYDYVVHTRLDTAWFSPVPPLESWYLNQHDRRRVVIHDRWAEFVSDTFALLPRHLADDYYSMEVLVKPGIMCLGGPNFNHQSLSLSSILDAGLPSFLSSLFSLPLVSCPLLSSLSSLSCPLSRPISHLN
jgi:hypothetical protein